MQGLPLDHDAGSRPAGHLLRTSGYAQSDLLLTFKGIIVAVEVLG
jgi:hypothetical protein